MTATETTQTTESTKAKPAEPRGAAVLDRPTPRRSRRSQTIVLATVVAVAVLGAAWIVIQLIPAGGQDSVSPEASVTQPQSQPQLNVPVRQPVYGSRGEVPATFESATKSVQDAARRPLTIKDVDVLTPPRRPLTIKDVDVVPPPRRPLTIKDVEDPATPRRSANPGDRPAALRVEAR